MRLNHECVRDILLTMESLDYGEILKLRDYKNKPLLAKYSEEDFVYTVKKLKEADYVSASIAPGIQGTFLRFSVDSVTWLGHQFLDTVRDNAVWEETKSITSKVAGVSLSILSDVAKDVLKKALGLG